MSQFLNILKSLPTESILPLVQNLNPELAEKLGVLDNFTNASAPVMEAVTNSIQENSPVLVDSISSISKVYRWRNILVITIALWAIFLIVSRILNPFPKVQEDLEKTNELLVGRTGVIQLIVMVWISAILIVTLVPAVLSLTPKIEKLLGITTAIIETIGLKK
jgi:hypothetical protein